MFKCIAMKSYGEYGAKDACILDHGTSWRQASLPNCFTHCEKSSCYTLDVSLGGSQRLSGCSGEETKLENVCIAQHFWHICQNLTDHYEWCQGHSCLKSKPFVWVGCLAVVLLGDEVVMGNSPGDSPLQLRGWDSPSGDSSASHFHVQKRMSSFKVSEILSDFKQNWKVSTHPPTHKFRKPPQYKILCKSVQVSLSCYM